MKTQDNIDKKLTSISLIKYIEKHEQNINCLLLLKDNRLASCGCDSKIIIYKEKTYIIDLIIEEHFDDVNYITQMKNGNLISCGEDQRIKIIKLFEKTYEVEHTLYLSNPVFFIVESEDDYLISCSKGITFWKKNKENNYETLKCLKDYCSNIYYIIEFKKNFFAFCSYNDKIFDYYNFIDNKSEFSLNNIDNNPWFASMIKLNERLIVIGGKNNMTIIDMICYQIQLVVETDDSIFCLHKLNDDYLISGDIGKINLYYIKDGEWIKSSENKKVSFTVLSSIIKINSHQIAMASDDNVIKIYNIHNN